jgi:hypothetical protein
MLDYRSHVYSKYAAAMTAAFWQRRRFVEWQAREDQREQKLGELREGYPELVAAIDALYNALPDEVLDTLRGTNLRRHLAFMERYLRQATPESAVGDSVDLTDRDLPGVWSAFEAWFQSHSAVDDEFVRKVDRLLNIGQGDSAIRKAFAVFKSRLVALFPVPSDLDGERLAVAVFGAQGSARGRVSDSECEGYLSLLKGLYALHRNETTHNDVTVDPQEAEAILMLLNSAIARLSTKAA